MFEWLTMERLGELADAMNIHPAELLDAIYSPDH